MYTDKIEGSTVSNIMVISDFCNGGPKVIKPITLYNLKNLDKPSKQIDIIWKDSGDPRIKNIMRKGETKRDIVCPTGNLNRRMVNYTPGSKSFYKYIKSYINTKPSTQVK